MSGRVHHGRTIGLSALSGAGKLLAIGKTMLVAALFGASVQLDAFWVAYSLPLLLPGILTTVVTVAFVPRFMASLDGRDGPDAWQGANTLFTVLLALSLLATVAMYLAADRLVALLAPGLPPASQREAADLTRILLPVVPLLTLSSVLSAVGNARERFLLPALDGVLTNLTVILSALLFARHVGVVALTFGVIAGFVLQAGVLLWGNRADLRCNLRPAFAWRHPDFVKPLGHFLPLLVGSAGATMTGLVNQHFLSHAGEGAISAMAYAVMVAFLPVEVFAQAVITTMYPSVSRHLSRGELAEASGAFSDGLRFMLFLTLPCAIGLVVFAEPLMVLLLERGAFGPDQTAMTASIASILALGIVARSVAYLGYRVLHAALRPWTQVAIGFAGVATHVALCHAWAAEGGPEQVAWAATLSMAQSALLSMLAAFAALRWRRPPGLVRALGLLVLMAVGMSAAAWCLRPLAWPPVDDARHVAAWCAMLAAMVAGLVAIAIGAWLRQPDVQWMRSLIPGRRRPRPV